MQGAFSTSETEGQLEAGDWDEFLEREVATIFGGGPSSTSTSDVGARLTVLGEALRGLGARPSGALGPQLQSLGSSRHGAGLAAGRGTG